MRRAGRCVTSIGRHTFGMAKTPPPLPPIPTVTTIDGVVEAINSIVDWSISVSSRLGYFAALYKRITIATGTAVSQGKFEDAPRMQRFDVTFATRYFDALNGYFHPHQFAKPTRSWRVTFDAASRPEPIRPRRPAKSGVDVVEGDRLQVAAADDIEQLAETVGDGGQVGVANHDLLGLK
jgi:hypothetical protein